MIHFFLHGWVASPDTEQNKKFFQAFPGIGKKILIFPFSEWTEKEINFDRNAEKDFFDKWMNIIIDKGVDKLSDYDKKLLDKLSGF